MSRFSLIFVSLLLGMWGLCSDRAVAQNRTTVKLDAEGKPDLTAKVEERVSRFLTELNRATYFDDRLDLSDQAITEAGHQDVLDAWNRAQFRCPETEFSRRLVSVEGTGAFEIRSIPLLVEPGEQSSKERSAVLVLDAVGRIDGFSYASEGSDPQPPGSITVRTKPPNSVVVSAIGGGTKERSPARFDHVPADVYAFNVHKKKYRSVLDTTLAVEADQHVDYTIRLTPKAAVVRFGELSEEARLFVDGQQRTVSGKAVQLDAGSHRIRVSRKYHTTWDSTLTLAPADTVRADPDLRRAATKLIAHSDPQGASVLVNGRSVGKTPIDTTLVAGRNYRIWLRKEGYVPSSMTRTVASADSAIERRVVLTPVEVNAKVENARLTNVRADRTRDNVKVKYGLVGVSGETYRVGVEVRGPDGNSLDLAPSATVGEIGAGLAPGSDKEIVLHDGFERAASIHLTLDETDGGNRLYYVIGSAVAAIGGGTLAAILMGGGDGGGRSFPPPPGLPN